VLTTKYGCVLPAKAKRQSTSSQLGTQSQQPVINPNDPASAYLTRTGSNCTATPGVNTIGAASDSNNLTNGAWVAVALAIIVVGVVLVLGIILVYLQATRNPYKRIETV